MSWCRQQQRKWSHIFKPWELEQVQSTAARSISGGGGHSGAQRQGIVKFQHAKSSHPRGFGSLNCQYIEWYLRGEVMMRRGRKVSSYWAGPIRSHREEEPFMEAGRHVLHPLLMHLHLCLMCWCCWSSILLLLHLPFSSNTLPESALDRVRRRRFTIGNSPVESPVLDGPDRRISHMVVDVHRITQLALHHISRTSPPQLKTGAGLWCSNENAKQCKAS